MKAITLALFLFAVNSGFAQSWTSFDNVPLEKKEDYKPAEQKILEAINNVYSAPFDDNEMQRLATTRFVLRWMTGTPDYNFDLGVAVTKNFKGNDELLGMYMLSMAKYVLENPSRASDSKLVQEGAMLILINYCENPDNHLKMTKGMRKISESLKKSV